MKRHFLYVCARAALLAFASIVMPSPLLAADPPVIATTEDVDAAIGRQAIIWDVRSEEDYRKGHIPGAVNIDDILWQLRDPKSEDYLPVAQIERILGDAGIDPSKEVVVYGAKAAPSAYFGLITLQWLGSDRASVYHGGIDDWKAAGRSVATDAVRRPPVTLKLMPRPEHLVTTGDVVARLRAGDAQFVDARTAREFNGDDIRALRGGHIPGALNVPYETNWVDPDTPRKLARKQVADKSGMDLKSGQELEALYAGLDRDKETIVYCQSGVRASNTAAILQSLGFRNVRVYDSSWLAYGNTLDAPAESVSYFNVARVNNMLHMLQNRIDDLEAQLTELKASRNR